METEKISYKLSNKTSNSKRGIKLLQKLFAPYTKEFVVLLIVLIVGSAFSVAIPYFIKIAIDDNIRLKDISGLATTAGIIGGLSLISLITSYFQIRFTGLIGQKALFELREKIFNKLQDLPIQFFAENKSGDIIQRVTNDVEYINRFLSEGVVRLVGLIFGMSFVFIAMVILEPILSIIPIITLAITGLFLFFHSQYVRNINKESLDAEGQVSSVALELLNGFKIIKSYGAEEQSRNTFHDVSQKSKKVAVKAFAISNFSAPVLDMLVRLGTLAAVVGAVLMYMANDITIGTIIAFLAYLEQFFRPLSGLASLWTNIQSGIAASERIDELLQLESTITQPKEAFSPDKDKIKGEVVFKNVGFKYPDSSDFVLKDISFEAKPGEKIAIVGQTGAGKTTLVNLIARLYDANAGEVIIDDINIKNWDLNKLRSQVGYILQDPFFFEDSILNNLTYPNPNLDKKDITEALDALGISDFVARLPKGLDTKLMKNAENISAGQRQILALARVILKKPKVLILDEATARVDTISEKVLDRALTKFMDKTTTFIIAHRLNTVENADKVIFIYENTILEYGRREDLMDKKGKYYELYSKFTKDLEVK